MTARRRDPVPAAAGSARWRRGATVGALLLATAACATTIESSTTGTAPDAGVSATTVVDVTGTPEELLDRLLAETDRLSGRVVDNDGQADAMARIDALYAQLRVQVETRRAELLRGFDSAIGLARSAVERRRPADADKAHNNLAVLAATLARSP